MKALTYRGAGKVGYDLVADPEILEPGDVVLEVEIAAICGSDLHVYRGTESGLDDGTAMGHEFVGRVAAVGSDVRTLEIGHRVVSPFTTSCGTCFQCKNGLTSRCERGQLFGWVQDGVGLHGGQAEQVRVPLADSTLVAVPGDIPVEQALLLGDVLPTGYYCALRAEIPAEGTAVVIGCGPVGLMAVISALEQGAGQVFAVDAIPERLELAGRFGAIPLNYRTDDLGGRVREATAGRGADAVLEVVGNAAAHRTAIDLVRPGGTVSVVGVHNESGFSFSPTEAYDRNLTYRVGRCPARHLMQRLVPLLRHARYDFDAVFSHRMPLAEGAAGYEMFDARREGCTKVLLRP